MVVVEGGRTHIDQTINIVVTSTLQTSAGRMVFGRIRSEHGGAAHGEDVENAKKRSEHEA